MEDQRISMSMEEQKKVMLRMLESFARFCEQHDLQYFLDAGTLLGAVRHGGFIPWDDDIDICMPRTDYDRFLSMVKETNGYFDEHYFVELPTQGMYQFIKIADDRTVLVEFPHKYPMEVCVYMDVFPKDGIKDNSKRSKRMCDISGFLGVLLWFNKYSIHAWKTSKSIPRRVISWVGRALIRKPNMPLLWQDRLIRRNQKRNPLSECKYVTTLTNGEFHKIAPKECFEGYVMMEFEGIPFRCPVGYDTYLRCLYPGDYMQLPPEEQRVKTHNTLVYWVSEEAKHEVLGIKEGNKE